MANSITLGGVATTALGTNKPPLLKTTPDAYISLGDILDYNKPDNRDLLVNTFGDQGITGFLQLTGAIKNAGVNDEVQWWEEGRLHPFVDVVSTTSPNANSNGTLTINGQTNVNDPATGSTTTAYQVRINDVLLLSNGRRILITAKSTDTSYTFKALDGLALSNPGAGKAAVIGNLHGQGSDQPSQFYQTDVTKRTNPYMIVKETYAVNGSQATNIGWINLGNGDYRWYIKGEQDTRKRFMDRREMMLLFGEKHTSAVTIGTGDDTQNITGSEGYFAAVEDRGLVADVSGGNQGTFAGLSDFDKIILELDKEGAPAEYAMYLNRKASLDIDDLLAQGIATQTTAGLAGQFGAFNNDADMAVKLGFKSFTRGGYTFHKHDWKLLNDPTTGGLNGYYKGAMVPMTKVTDARTGMKAPALEMNYKGTNGYNRDMEHWVMGSILGHTNMSKDVAEFYYRSECNLVTRAANQHVIIK